MKKKYIIRIIIFIVIIILAIVYYIGGFFYRDHCNKNGLVRWTSNTKNALCDFGDNIYPQEESKQWKPIIYLYPKQEEKLTIKLGYPKSITTSYPKYEDSWNVIAYPNGDLIDLKTNQKLYALYYENKSNYNFQEREEGFVIKGEDTIDFLEEKLSILGLNYKEREEFIVYWLPKLEKNKYNYIRFATIDEQNQSMPLELSKEPDTLIRVMMTYKPLDKPKKVKEQKLDSPKRKGFIVVEWGGTTIN